MAVPNAIPIKTYSSTFLYGKANLQYEKHIMEFILKGERINKNTDAFADVKYDVKRRQVSNSIIKVLESDMIVLVHNNMPMPKAFKVFADRDIKDKSRPLRAFIDVSDLMKMVDGKWVCGNVDILIAYLISAMDQVIYYKDPKRLLMSGDIINCGAAAFSSLFTNIIDYIYKISTTQSIKDKCLYLSAMYYMVNILGKDVSDSTKNACKRISGLSEREEQMIFIQIDEKSCFVNIKFFVDEINKVLKLDKLNIDLFIEKWLFLYGTGTHFALEFYPAFATMMTNVYVGCYINNQKTIEKIAGKNMIEFSTAVLRIGAEAI